MFSFMCIIYVVFAVIHCTATVVDYIFVKAGTDLRHNFIVNATETPTKPVTFFKNGKHLGHCIDTCVTITENIPITLTKINSNNVSYTIQLTMLNATRTSWSETIVMTNGTNLTSNLCCKEVYRLIIYSDIKHIDCEFQAEEDGVTMTCSTQDIFPIVNSFCIYETSRIDGSCYATNSTDGRFRKNSTCSFKIATVQLRMGNTPIFTIMYLDITGNETKDINFGTNRSTILHLEYPTVTLDAGCTGTSGYILEGQTGQCTCHRTDTSDVVPDIVWYYPNNTIAADNAYLTFSATRDSSFNCTSRFSFGWAVNYTYTPLVAYGPENVNFSLYPKEEDIHLCHDRQTNIKVLTIRYECTVLEDEVFPFISIEIRQNNSILNSDAEIYNVTNTTLLVKGGAYIFSCLAKNIQFGNVNVSKTLTKNVIEAPNKLDITILQINTNKNTTYIIQCEVIGGYPVVSNITFECGSYNNASINSTTVTLAVHASTDLKGVNCSCKASHISKCYDSKAAVMPLSDLIPPPIRMELTITLGASISAALCLLVIILLATFIVQRKGSTQQKKYNLKEPSEMKNYDIYFYQSSNIFYPNVYKSYDMIIPTITSAACGPLNSTENIYFNSC